MADTSSPNDDRIFAQLIREAFKLMDIDTPEIIPTSCNEKLLYFLDYEGKRLKGEFSVPGSTEYDAHFERIRKRLAPAGRSLPYGSQIDGLCKGTVILNPAIINASQLGVPEHFLELVKANGYRLSTLAI